MDCIFRQGTVTASARPLQLIKVLELPPDDPLCRLKNLWTPELLVNDTLENQLLAEDEVSAEIVFEMMVG